jgi:hypothetical protein
MSRLRIYDIPEQVISYNIGNTFHTYHMEGLGRHITASVDGQTVFNLTHTEATGGTRTIFFGDGVFSGSTVSEWDDVRITSPLPEPSALSCTALIVLGGLCRRANRNASSALIIADIPVS